MFSQGLSKVKDYSISYWHTSYKGMQLFTGHDIIISCSISKAQKNETLGSSTLHKKKGNGTWYPSYVSWQTISLFALVKMDGGGSSWLCGICWLSSLMACTVSTDGATSVEHA